MCSMQAPNHKAKPDSKEQGSRYLYCLSPWLRRPRRSTTVIVTFAALLMTHFF